MHWANPMALIGLGLLVIFGVCESALKSWRERARRQLLEQPFSDTVFPLEDPRRSFVKRGLWYLAWVLLIVAFARPQGRLVQQNQTVRGLDGYLVLDCSLSMRACDSETGIDRLSLAKKLLGQFLEQRVNDRLGLIAFAGEARMLCPATQDHAALQLALTLANPSAITMPGSNPASGISLALQKLEKKSSGDKYVLLLTDGEQNNGSNVETLARTANEQGVRIISIGVGSLRGGFIPLNQDFWGKLQYCSFRGALVKSHLMPRAIRKLAELSGGRYFEWESEPGLLGKILTLTRQWRQNQFRQAPIKAYREWFPWICAAAGLCLLLEGLIFIQVRRDSYAS